MVDGATLPLERRVLQLLDRSLHQQLYGTL